MRKYFYKLMLLLRNLQINLKAMGTYVAYMSKPFFKTEIKEMEQTEKEINEYLESHGYSDAVIIHKVEQLGYTVFIFIDKELSMNPIALSFLNCEHTKFAWIMRESLDSKGEGGFL